MLPEEFLKEYFKKSQNLFLVELSEVFLLFRSVLGIISCALTKRVSERIMEKFFKKFLETIVVISLRAVIAFRVFLSITSETFANISSTILQRCAPKVLPNTPSGIWPMHRKECSEKIWKEFLEKSIETFLHDSL